MFQEVFHTLVELQKWAHWDPLSVLRRGCSLSEVSPPDQPLISINVIVAISHVTAPSPRPIGPTYYFMGSLCKDYLGAGKEEKLSGMVGSIRF